jgi:hypothetical protein
MFSEDCPSGFQASSLDEYSMEKKKARFGQAISADAIWAISPNHILNTLQLLQLQWRIEAFTLQDLSNHLCVIGAGQT